MLDELTHLFSYTQEAKTCRENYLKAILEDNCLGKRSGRTRSLSARHLVDLYALDPDITIFKAFLYFWNRDKYSRPLLALLSSIARDSILRSSIPYDIFVRWKPMEKQPIGWHPDLNDGVRLNIQPFLTVGDIKKKGAGVLRDKPNIKWAKDRGKDVISAPWYTLGLEYGGKEGDHINDHHLTLEEKTIAQAVLKKEVKT